VLIQSISLVSEVEEKPPQQLSKRGLVVAIECSKKVQLLLEVGLEDYVDYPAPLFGEANHEGASIRRVGMAFHQTSALEPIEPARHPTRRDEEGLGELRGGELVTWRLAPKSGEGVEISLGAEAGINGALIQFSLEVAGQAEDPGNHARCGGIDVGAHDTPLFEDLVGVVAFYGYLSL
jgi:hypothetical protein